MKYEELISETPIKLRGWNNDKMLAAKNFENDFYNSTTEHPLNNKARIYGNSHAMISVAKDGIHVHDIQSHDQGSGAGTKMLQHMINLADKHKVDLYLFATGYANTTDDQLKKWYERHGFVFDDDTGLMIRVPK